MPYFEFKTLCGICLYLSGYPHEATRNDRDDYISVDYDQLKFASNESSRPKLVNEYRKCKNSEKVKQRTYWWCKMLIGPYDTRSITHYPSKVNDHMKDVKPRNVIKTKKCSPEGCEFGQRYELSQLDVIHLGLLYNCSKFYINQFI